jgi:hypothetical protein
MGEWSYISTNYFTSALDGGEWSASLPGRFTPKEISPGTHWTGGWVGPRAVLDAVVKRKIPSFYVLIFSVLEMITVFKIDNRKQVQNIFFSNFTMKQNFGWDVSLEKVHSEDRKEMSG